jgi:hypothetical protein
MSSMGARLGPLEVAYRVSLAEPGGRAVNRSRTQYGWPAGSQWPALKADFVAERVEGASRPSRSSTSMSKASRWRGR